jgi:alpha-glucosidase
MLSARTSVGRCLRGGAAAIALAACGGQSAAPPSVRYTAADRHLRVEIADDDLVHFEWSATPESDAPIATSPMIASGVHPGPSRFTDDGHGTLSTATLQLNVDPESLCVAFTDLRPTPPAALTSLCPSALDAPTTSVTLSRNATEHLYGLGEHFLAAGEANGDLLGQTIPPGNAEGNAILPFNGGNTGHAQFPILYALGNDGRRYAVFLDQPSAQTWDLSADPWQVSMAGDAIRGYFLAGRDLLAIRREYMNLVGRPPVPPKKMFGLWVSEFGYDNWAELEDKLGSLRSNDFPVDGFVLDLQWYGGVFHPNSDMGELRFDERNFPDPADEIARLRNQHGVGLMLIEEPYVDSSRPVYADLAQRGYFARSCDGCGPVELADFWGRGSMLDWTSPAAGNYWHDVKRQPLVDLGVLAHWTDLGEPDPFSPTAWYAGFPARGLHGEADVHNLYSFEWAASIQRGYARHGVAARPFILSRSGTAGIERFGAAMWSGDIGSNMGSLAAQLNVQMHMSFSGLDYFGSDIGGFFRNAGDDNGDPGELYTQWFADSTLFDVPVRPHTLNLCNCFETAPDRVGDPASNLANLRLRYRLIPYLYSLAHRAHRFGEPVIAPLVLYYADDPNVAALGDEKLLGRDLLAAAVSAYGQSARDVYLPTGTWIDFRTQEWLDSAGGRISAPVRRDGLLQVPLYARAGAIIPEMYVDGETMNALGQRSDGSTHDELIARVYADPQRTHFTLYEDDGATVAYERGEVRTTEISQYQVGNTITVIVAASVGQYAGAPTARDNVIELAVRGLPDPGPRSVTLNGAVVKQAASQSAFADSSTSAWYAAEDGLLLLRSGRLGIEVPKTFRVDLAGTF